MKTLVFKLRALTNLHPGSGDVEYGVVDKLVQRDPITRFPTIHMSAIKGALREYFTRKDLTKTEIAELFGSEPNVPESEMRQGALRFISAELLAFPRPANNGDLPYELVAPKDHLDNWKRKVELFDAILEESDLISKEVQEITMKSFRTLVEELPVVARNYLDNGISKNLWYEEFVPRESIFGMIVQCPENLEEDFAKHVNEHVIQLGGNATVGYGYCLFTKISKS